jgi:hypothetical protein
MGVVYVEDRRMPMGGKALAESLAAPAEILRVRHF